MKAFRILLISSFMMALPVIALSGSAPDEGKTVYDAKCKMCHVADGTGNPALAKTLKIDPALLDLTTDKNKKRTDKELTGVVRKGQDTMKAIGVDKVTDKDLANLVTYVRQLQKTAK